MSVRTVGALRDCLARIGESCDSLPVVLIDGMGKEWPIDAGLSYHTGDMAGEQPRPNSFQIRRVRKP